MLASTLSFLSFNNLFIGFSISDVAYGPGPESPVIIITVLAIVNCL